MLLGGAFGDCDFNPIHTVVPFAEQVGLGGVIAHGMLIMGFAGQAICTWFPNQEVKEFSVRFKAMTRPGEKLIVLGRIVSEEDEHEHWQCEALVGNDDEIKMSAEFLVNKV
ncbi:3-hydroxyacyl-ACP dehydratase [Sporosarcina sp. P13]|uniref:MaoC/PaaZ C-terminal domain-containing protein n=1 Tax=Sporosarcina sp. P13 TaxID=2048263 RepID=UPI000C16B6CB|nr:MaoC/PaaZ C-terminal domain-containing protein [Sporosarcina sp. P13]PIC62741.1 3-hydroxyacyl-ACP dehydratase [Sporosarcina sp. P13]